MSPEKQTDVRERLIELYMLNLEARYDKTASKKNAIRELKAELLAEGLDNDVVIELIKNAQRR